MKGYFQFGQGDAVSNQSGWAAFLKLETQFNLYVFWDSERTKAECFPPPQPILHNLRIY